MSVLARAVSRGQERRGANPSSPWGSSEPPSNASLGMPIAGVNVSESTALAIGAVYACMRILTDSVATIPLYTYRGVEENKKSVSRPPLLVRPYSEISRIDWMVQATMSLGLRGNFYGRIVERDQGLYPAQIQPVHPDHASVRRVANGADKGRPEYRFNGEVVPLDDVFHLRYISVPGSLVGINPIEYQRIAFGLAAGADLYGANFFSNSASPGGVITVDGDLDPDETLAMAENWMQAHQGIGRSHLPAVLTGGAKWEQITLAPDDAQFIQSRQFSQNEIAMIFGIPPHWVGVQDRSPTSTGIEDQQRAFNNITLNGYLRRFEEAFSDDTVTGRGVYAEFNLDERLKGDALQRFQTYTLARNASILTPDEIRKAEGKPPLPDGLGENVLMPLNMAVVDLNGGVLPQPNAPKPVQSGGEPQAPGGLDKPPVSNPQKGMDA